MGTNETKHSPTDGAARSDRSTGLHARVLRPVRRLVPVLRVVFVVAALGWLVREVVRDRAAVVEGLETIGAASAASALVAAVVGLGATGLAWRAILASLGSQLPRRLVPPVFFVAQAGKYVPGSVWPYLAQVQLSREQGVPRTRGATVSVLFVMAHCATGAVVATLLLPSLVRDGQRPVAWLVFAAVPLLVLFHPAVLRRLLGHVHRLLRRGEVPEHIDGRRLALALLWLMVAWLFYGASLLMLVGPVAPSINPSLFTLSLGAYAFAWTIGFLAAAALVVAAPAGLGFREVALIAALTPVMSPATATAVALLSRVVHTVADGLWAGLGVLMRRHGRSAATRKPA